MTPRGHVSNLREQQSDLCSPATYGAGPSYDTTIPYHSSQLYLSSSSYGGPQQELAGYHENFSPFLMSHATNAVVPSGTPIQSSSFGSLYHAQLDYDSPQYENFPWQGLMPDMSDPLLQHYMNTVYRMQYQLVDMEKLPRILLKHLKNSGMARDAAVLLSVIHKEGGQRVLSHEGPTRTPYDELLQLFRLSEDAYNEDSSPPSGTHWSRQNSASVYQDPEYTEAPESDKGAVAHQTTTFLRDIANSNFVESTVHFVGGDQHQIVNNNNQQISESYNTYNVHNTGQFIEYVGQMIETTTNNDNRVTINVNLHPHTRVSDQAIIFVAGVGIGGFVTFASTSKLEASKQRESTAVIPFDPRHADFLANLILAVQLLPRALFRFCIYLYERVLPNIEEA